MTSLFDGPIPNRHAGGAPRGSDERSAPSGFVGLFAGGGVYYGLDADNEGKLVVDDTYTVNRQLLEGSPAVNIASRVISRLLAMIDMRLLDADGNDHNSRGEHPVLRLWNTSPNEFQTAREFRAMVAQEIVYTGEMIARINRVGMAPERIYLWDADNVYVEFLTAEELSRGSLAAVRYQFGTQSLVFDPDMPEVLHVRQNPHPLRILRGRPSVYGMRREVLANIYATLYRSEVFRQGGPPRLALVSEGDENDIGARPSETQGMEAAAKFSQTVKTPNSYLRTAKLPDKWKVEDLGPKATDPLMIDGSRHTDEKILAAYGVPITFANSQEHSTYNNIRTQDRQVVRDAVSPILDLIASAVERDLLRPMGGVNARLKVGWDLTKAVEAEQVVWNKIVLDRLKGSVISTAEAREELGYDPEDVPTPEELPLNGGGPASGGGGTDPIDATAQT